LLNLGGERGLGEGFTVIDAGELKIARLLEPYGMLWIHLALMQKVPGDFAFALLKK
jgi:predicted dinucleotide-binding enzyme